MSKGFLLIAFAMPLVIALAAWLQHRERWWVMPIGLFLAFVSAGGMWVRDWQRRAFDPQTPEDVAKAPGRQALGTAIVVWSLIGVGALLAVLAAVERLKG